MSNMNTSMTVNSTEDMYIRIYDGTQYVDTLRISVHGDDGTYHVMVRNEQNGKHKYFWQAIEFKNKDLEVGTYLNFLTAPLDFECKIVHVTKDSYVVSRVDMENDYETVHVHSKGEFSKFYEPVKE